MKENVKEKELENFEDQSNVIPLSDIDPAGSEDWLTPMNRFCEFVCTERDRFHQQIYLQSFTKIINYEFCVEIIEHSPHYDTQERVQRVFAKLFCKKYRLVEIINEHTGSI